MCGGAGDVGSGGVRRGDPAGGLGALRPLPEPGGLPGPGRCEEADPDLLRGALLWAYGLRAERNDKGGRLTASKLVHGGQDHCGFRHSNE